MLVMIFAMEPLLVVWKIKKDSTPIKNYVTANPHLLRP